MNVLPAIDLRGGRVVRLRQGDYARERQYDDAPRALARRYAAAGAAALHVVDLDGARDGAFGNLAAIAAIVGSGVPVQAGGGVRAEADVQRLLDLGVARVVVGSVAVREPARVGEWIARFGADRLVIALDARHDGAVWRLPVFGWTELGDATLDALVARYAALGARHVLCTDIARDGMLAGPNLALYSHVRALAPDVALQASGGVRDGRDLAALRAAGLAAAVVGRSLLDGVLPIAEALAC